MLQVICKQCNHCRDIDLCKDPHQSQLSGGAADKAPVWVCASASCGAAYDTAEIEHHLVDALQRKSMGFTLQDLQVGACLYTQYVLKGTKRFSSNPVPKYFQN